MLIVPIGDKDGRRTTPWVCILLILINTLIYAWTTHRDYQRDEPLQQNRKPGWQTMRPPCCCNG